MCQSMDLAGMREELCLTEGGVLHYVAINAMPLAVEGSLSSEAEEKYL